jgi:hypothetical protein
MPTTARAASSRKLLNRVRPIVIFVLLVAPYDRALATEPVTVTGAELVEYGVYRTRGLKFEMPPNTKARHFAEVPDIKVYKKTDVISAALGTTFGITYTITGTPPKAEVNGVVEVVHPPTPDPKTGKTSTVSKGKFQASIGVATYSDINLDQPQDVVSGQWTFRVIYNSKVLLEKSFQVNEARQASESEATLIEGVPIFGRIDAVIADDIREIIKEATDNSNSEPRKPRAIEVMSADEVRAYLPERTMGWRPLRLGPVIEPDGHEHLRWGSCSWMIDNTDGALRLIRTADELYVFPLPNPSKPERDDQHLRRLGPNARRDLARLLGYEKDWFQGHYSLVWVEPPAPSIGFVFRRGNDELVLFFTDTVAEGTYKGENTSGLLDDSRHKQFERWKKRYAKEELKTAAAQAGTTPPPEASPKKD